MERVQQRTEAVLGDPGGLVQPLPAERRRVQAAVAGGDGAVERVEQVRDQRRGVLAFAASTVAAAKRRFTTSWSPALRTLSSGA